jgi:hypothetical protein
VVVRPSSEISDPNLPSSEISYLGLPSRFVPSPQANHEENPIQVADTVAQGDLDIDMKEIDDNEEQKSPISSWYYSVASKRTSILSFLTTRSRQTSNSRESRASYADEAR